MHRPGEELRHHNTPEEEEAEEEGRRDTAELHACTDRRVTPWSAMTFVVTNCLMCSPSTLMCSPSTLKAATRLLDRA